MSSQVHLGFVFNLSHLSHAIRKTVCQIQNTKYNFSCCSLPRAVGQVTLRDFKQLFDRPGFFRYHFKTMDKEFGMVKEEVGQLNSTKKEDENEMF